MQVQEQDLSIALLRRLEADRAARRVRLGLSRVKPRAVAAGVDPAPFYSQMWMWDLVNPAGRPSSPTPTVLHIRNVVCDYFGVLPIDIESSRRQGSLVYPRQLAFFLARYHTPHSYPQIARRFGNRDHTTIMHGVKRIEARVKEEWLVAYDVAHLEAML